MNKPLTLERGCKAIVTRTTADGHVGDVVELVRRERHNGAWYWDCLKGTGGDYLMQMLIPEDALEATR